MINILQGIDTTQPIGNEITVARENMLRGVRGTDLGDIGGIGGIDGLGKLGSAVPLEGPSFGDILGGLVESAASRGHAAGDKANGFARGMHDDLHGTMISSKEAEISLKLVGTVRNKLLDAFHELWRTTV